MSGAFETLRIATAGHVATLTLAREERRNAVNARMNEELPQAWQQLEADPQVRVIVVTGAGD
ncbi:MAG: enoyl-CoA hydratase/isomerase family protein, partial [Erythrobacter sp.]|nr:enoyl-CoA hydratase/isomerase family protein [Erythrobacter sp.]